ncbi:hypothetical protein [Alicyclobacillus macrosporangiidus]|uniref:hypothetical protein n=1 Tax=Alicyclobacillus macrosporangiidus TaxID=392015 RepID=UPI000496884B|nr:hypothetical protein [Alicyclobacillus macrosporangiidus]
MIPEFTLTGAGILAGAYVLVNYREARLVQRAARHRGLCERDAKGRPRPWRLIGQRRDREGLTMRFKVPPGVSYADIVSDDSPNRLVPALWELFGPCEVRRDEPGQIVIQVPAHSPAPRLLDARGRGVAGGGLAS